MKVQVARIVAPVHNLGPGRRVGVWFQGCSLACDGCVSPGLWSVQGGTAYDIRALAATCAGVAGDLAGVTLSGGEPFEQPYGALMAFALLYRSLCDGTVVAYTGYELDELDAMFPDGAFRQAFDVVVTGRYRAEQPSADGRVGSTNQDIHCFGGRIDPKNGWNGPWTVVPGRDGVVMTGVPAPGVLDALGTRLASEGREVRWQ